MMNLSLCPIAHVHTSVVIEGIAAKMACVPTMIYTAHDFYFHGNMSRLSYRFYNLVEKIYAKLFTDYIFTQSEEEDRELAIKKKFLLANKITVIGNGVDVNGKFNPANIDENKSWK